MDLTSIFVIGIIFAAIYKVIELLVRRKERLCLIDKITELPPEILADKLPNLKGMQSILNESDAPAAGGDSRFRPLRWGCLGTGLGLGLLIAGIFMSGCHDIDWAVRNWIMSGAVVTTTGIGLLIAFAVEHHLRRKKD